MFDQATGTAGLPVVLAHAFGARYDLPIPLTLFVLGGALVVLASFALVSRRVVRPGAAARAAVLDVTPPAPAGRAATVAGAVSVVFLAFLVWVGLTGSQEVAENALPTWFWLVVWIAIPLSCGLLGNWTRPVNPFAFLARLADRPGLRRAVLGGPDPVAWPRWLGWWPATVLFFAAACGELIFNLTLTVPHNTAIALLLYAAASTVAGFLFGPAWSRRGEFFGVLYDTWGRLGWRRFGGPGRPGFAGGLDVPFEPSVSRVAFVLLMLVNVNFDGLLATPRWASFERRLPWNVDAVPDRLELFRTGVFVLLILALATVFGAFALAGARAGGDRAGPRDALTGLLPSLVPIAFGYLFAHNFQYLLVNGQMLAPLTGNPTGHESWPVHLPYPFDDDYEVHRQLMPSGVYWYLAVAVIVAVHVLAVVLAHRHLAARTSDHVAARRGEYPWLVAMVGYTMLSLWLLAQPLVKEAQPAGSEPGAVPPPAPVATAPAPWGPG